MKFYGLGLQASIEPDVICNLILPWENFAFGFRLQCLAFWFQDLRVDVGLPHCHNLDTVLWV